MPGDSSLLGPALISGAISLAVGVAAAFLSHKKLKLDLFEKRYAVYEALIMTAQGHIEELDDPSQNVKSPLDGVIFRTLWTHGRQIQFLFGPEVFASYQAIFTHAEDLQKSALWFRLNRNRGTPQEAIDAELIRYGEGVEIMRERVQHFVEVSRPYLRQYSRLRTVGWWLFRRGISVPHAVYWLGRLRGSIKWPMRKTPE